MNTNNLTVLILAAGYGRRMGPFSRMVNKGLVPYGDKALISHIIEKFPEDTNFIIACGHLGQQVKDYVGNVHNKKNVTFVDIQDYSESNTGPATTIQYCKDHINGPFFWLACDTLFDFSWQDKMDHSWIGVCPVDSKISKDYCWVKRDGDTIVEVHNKLESNTAVDAFIGLMFSTDTKYIENLVYAGAKETYEGFDGLELKAHTVREWLDFGTYEKYQELSKIYPENSFIKPDELFYHDNGKIVKYFTNKTHVDNRVKRAQFNLECMPKNVIGVGNFLIHDYANGDIIYNQYTPGLFLKFLDWCDKKLWIDINENANIKEACDSFYYKKTMERVNQFRVKYSEWSECQSVNGKQVKNINHYLSLIDWNWLSDTAIWKFVHGDLHFDNMIYCPKQDNFTVIDWRTDFSGYVGGDIYYDLAKLLGGLHLNYRKVKSNQYGYTDNQDSAFIEIPSVENVEIYENILHEWVNKKGLDWNKVQVLVPLIYLNMSPLHEPPFDKFLIALAQLKFSTVF